MVLCDPKRLLPLSVYRSVKVAFFLFSQSHKFLSEDAGQGFLTRGPRWFWWSANIINIIQKWFEFWLKLNRQQRVFRNFLDPKCVAFVLRSAISRRFGITDVGWSGKCTHSNTHQYLFPMKTGIVGCCCWCCCCKKMFVLTSSIQLIDSNFYVTALSTTTTRASHCQSTFFNFTSVWAL